MSTLLPGFEYRRVDVDGVTVNCAADGSGPPVLLLHGYPENHLMWHRVAPDQPPQFTPTAAPAPSNTDAPP